MLTLTLPCRQLHGDPYVKKYLLNEYLSIIRKKYELKHYIWKAEKQNNGNIHFHLIIDRYIHFKEVNRLWNQILNTHGYIDEYRKAQEQLHKDGFSFRGQLKKNWDYYSQLKAYKYGKKTGWTNPSATTDIHSLKKIKSVRAYLGKYISKNPDREKSEKQYIEKYCKDNNILHPTPGLVETIKAELKQKLTVIGNLWYISTSLSKLKNKVVELTDDIKVELDYIKKNMPEKVKTFDYAIVFCLSVKELYKKKINRIFGHFKDYILSIREQIYSDIFEQSSPLGLALPLFDD